MGLLLSIAITYAGANQAVECLNYLLNGILAPNTQPSLEELAEFYRRQLRKDASANCDWARACGQGYLYLTEDKKGRLSSAAVKYYDGQPDSVAILFSQKISSFGDSVEESSLSQGNGDCGIESYIPTKTKIITSNTSGSFKVGYRNRSPAPDSDRVEAKSSERDQRDANYGDVRKEKLTWEHSPQSSTQSPPEIHFQSYDDDKKPAHSEDYLRSLDGIKYRPLQRSDPSGRRRSFRKRHSSSSTSSKDSRASREEELKMFTSLEEAEFERMNKEAGGFGSTPNISARSYSRSPSRENSKERRHDNWSVEASVDSVPDEDFKTELKPKLKELPKLPSFDEEKKTEEVIEEEEEVDFWANLGD